MDVKQEHPLQPADNGVWRAPHACIIDRSGRKMLPIGDDGFDTAAPNSVLVDKSRLIVDILNSGYKVMLFCRPRRFGKTLNMTMIKSFFEIPTDGVSRAPLFEGSDVWEAESGRYRQYQGVYPVIHLSMRTAKGLTWEQTYGSLCSIIASEYRRHDYLLTGDRLSDNERGYIDRIAGGKASDAEYADSLRRLAIMLREHHGRNVVVLIDEYDAPIMAAYSAPNGGYYDQAVGFLKSWMTGVLKDGGESLAFACLTGVQRISKESIFSDLNNLVVNTALSTDFEERYGFTENEVAALGAYLGHRDFMDEARTWYDGYRFGRQDAYNPWSVLNYFKQGCEADVYWGNTSGNSVVGELIHNADQATLDEIYALMEPGGVVAAPLDLGIVFPDLKSNPKAIWSMLYLSGYLTTGDVKAPSRVDVQRRLRIPDLEISLLYKSEIISRFADMAGGNIRLLKFQQALVSGDTDIVKDELTKILRDGASSFDMLSENSLHMLMLGLCFGTPGYSGPRSNRESGYGRYDIRLTPSDSDADLSFVTPKIRPLITIELKFVKDNDLPVGADIDQVLDAKAHKALAQIADRGYDEGELPAIAQGRQRWGIAACGKRCAVVAERVC